MKLHAFIMRGVPGSGKSTVAKKLAGRRGIIHSADSYRWRNGKYHFDPAETSAIYEKNFLAFSKSIAAKIPVVICDNTNVRRIDMDRYIALARAGGYFVSVVSMPHPDPALAALRNRHKVPIEVIQAMIKGWEPY